MKPRQKEFSSTERKNRKYGKFYSEFQPEKLVNTGTFAHRRRQFRWMR